MAASHQFAFTEPGGPAPAAAGIAGAASGPAPAAEDGARHRLPRQRTVTRGSTVLGVAAIAAVGAGGVASAAGRPPAPVAVPDLPPAGALAASSAELSGSPGSPLAAAGQWAAPDAGRQLITRILDQARSPRPAPSAHPAAEPPQQDDRNPLGTGRQAGGHGGPSGAGPVARPEAGKPAAPAAEAVRQQAAVGRDAERQVADTVADREAAKEAAARKVREQVARKKAEEEARREAEARAAAEARALSYLKPVASATLTAGFGESGSLWGSAHAGQDFAAPTGTPVLAVHGGTITSAGWAGSFGYRIVLTLRDGTELWYCHLSSMVKTSDAVRTGDVIGRVGATGNVTSPHLHLEVRPGGGEPVDPVGWLREHGVAV